MLKGVSFTQLPVNMNDATTVHKLQGISKDKLIVVSYLVFHGKLDICCDIPCTHHEGSIFIEISPI